jgi:adenylate cyclase
MEYELRFLAKVLPADLKEHKSKELIDLYIPEKAKYPRMRIRQSGSKLEITKKVTINGDLSAQEEHNIALNKTEFEALMLIPGKKVHKTRYYYPVGRHKAEINIFKGALEGLITIEFEFTSATEMKNFTAPSFCGTNITQEKFISGGMLAGKKIVDIADDLQRCTK